VGEDREYMNGQTEPMSAKLQVNIVLVPFKVILGSYLMFKKMNECITDR